MTNFFKTKINYKDGKKWSIIEEWKTLDEPNEVGDINKFVQYAPDSRIDIKIDTVESLRTELDELKNEINLLKSG